jgi:membrane fusion protein (multidrug efflux system)
MKETLIKRKKTIFTVGLALLLFLTGYWRYSILYPSTDNAYVQANIVNVAPQISGRVDQVFVKNNQAVKAGNLLFTIDTRPFVIAEQQAQAQLEISQQQIAANQDAIATAEAVLLQRQAEFTNANIDSARAIKLAKKGVLPRQAADDATAKIATSLAALNAAKAQLQQAQDTYGKAGDQNALLKQAKATLAHAQLNVTYTKIYASADGKVENLTLRAGDVVNANTPIFALVDDAQWWVDANYNETDMRRIHVNQPAKIELDMYPNKKFKGIVESISVGSGVTFSLLPPENATGNWVKITQRFPVRIRFLSNDDVKNPLRVGASATVTINTRN